MNIKNNRRFQILSLAVCVAVAVTGAVIALTASKNTDDLDEDITGCYVFEKNIFTNPLSSSIAFGEMPYVYGFSENEFIFANTGGGAIRTYTVEYCKIPVSADVFTSEEAFPFGSLFSQLDLSGFKERYLLAVMTDEYGSTLELYRIDNEIWLVDFAGIGIWTIYRLVRTEATTLADLERARQHYADNPQVESRHGMYENPPRYYENQITLTDIFALARKGKALTLNDFEPFFYWLSGPDFTERLYEVAGADVLFVRAKSDTLESALLWSRRTVDMSQATDLREGFEAVAEYLNPLNALMNYTIVDAHGGEDGRELIYDYDYDQCRYYLSPRRADSIYVIFHDGESMLLKQALEARRISIEDAVASGLSNVFMVPADNPLGGEFAVLHHWYTFSLNGEAFYPSKSFMYAVWDNAMSVYYDIDELIRFFEWYGYGVEAIELRQSVSQVDTVAIASGNYVLDTVLAEVGIDSDVGWELSSHTPVRFIIR